MIRNGKDAPLSSGNLPQVNGALYGLFQPMVFTVVTKVANGPIVSETAVNYAFRGTIQPFTEQQLQLLPEGQRSWKWQLVHAEPTLKLKPDDAVEYGGQQYRVMRIKDYSIYGYMEYCLVQDYTGAGP